MDSPYFEGIEIKRDVEGYPFDCSSSMMITSLIKPDHTSESASGMIIARGNVGKYPVFVKIFPMPCNFIHIRHGDRVIIRKRIKLDPNALEIAFTRMFSDFSCLSPCPTQNLVQVYDMRKCEFGFDTMVSQCTGLPLPVRGTLVSDPRTPQYHLKSRYDDHQLDDQVNYMVVEWLSGDLKGLLMTTRTTVSIEKFEQIWNSVFLQIIITLKIMNDYCGIFLHRDLGPRNILYSFNLLDNTYFQYNCFGRTFYVQNMGFIPKIWDFSHCFIDDHVRQRLLPYIDYLRPDDALESFDEPVYNIPQLSGCIYELSKDLGIEDREFCQKMNHLSKLDHDDFEYCLDLFDVYIPEGDEIRLEPVFTYK